MHQTPEIPVSRYREAPASRGIYFIIRRGKVIYLGQSKNMSKRIAQHYGGTVFPVMRGDCATCIVVEEPVNVVELERRLIGFLRPKFNYAFNPSNPRAKPCGSYIGKRLVIRANEKLITLEEGATLRGWSVERLRRSVSQRRLPSFVFRKQILVKLIDLKNLC